MGHFVGILTDATTDAAPARSAALAAISALCACWPQAVVDFFFYGGVSTAIQMLLQPERDMQEARAAVRLLQTVAQAAPEECREIMGENGAMGVEVLAQVHRDAEAAHEAELAAGAVQVLAMLTFECAPINPSLPLPSQQAKSLLSVDSEVRCALLRSSGNQLILAQLIREELKLNSICMQAKYCSQYKAI
jgi:hypothetical protein